MATESAITTDGSHPYSTGSDECLVHNGSLSNHNNLRRDLIKRRINFKSENDTEVAAGYISNHLSTKKNLKETLKNALGDLDGFYTFITGTKKGFAKMKLLANLLLFQKQKTMLLLHQSFKQWHIYLVLI